MTSGAIATPHGLLYNVKWYMIGENLKSSRLNFRRTRYGAEERMENGWH